MKKAYVVNYGVKNGCRICPDTAIVFAENETEAESVIKNYFSSFNKTLVSGLATQNLFL